jgi:homocysteine S-methyltransferase
MDSTTFRAALASRDPIVLDGGLATQLEAQGADLSDRLWSARLLVEDPEAIAAAHLAFYRAGARVATTASYQATFEGFAARGIDRAAAESLLRRSVDLAVAARGRHVAEIGAGNPRAGDPPPIGCPRPAAPLFVAASVGPYGAMLADGSEYRGRYGRSVGELRDFHRDRLVVLASTPADVLAVETIPEIEEIEAVVGLLAERPDTAAWISVTCQDGRRLRSGAPVEEAVIAAAATPGVVAVGVNCTAPAFAEEIVARMRAVTALPIAAYPNSGEGWDAVARRWTGAASERVDAAAAARWRAAGATLVGGCCRVTPDQIAALSMAAASSPALGSQ